MAVNIPGSAAYINDVECGPAVAYPSTGAELTLMGWAYMPTATAISGYRSFFSLPGTTNGFWVGTSGDGQTFILSNFSTTSYTGSVLPLTQWIHIAATYTSRGSGDSTFRGYINGKLDIDVDDTLVMDNFNWMPVIGNYAQSYPLNGYVEDVRLFTRAMRQDEIIREMQSSTPVDTTSIYSWMPLDKSITRDASGKAMVTVTTTGTSLVRGPNRYNLGTRVGKFP